VIGRGSTNLGIVIGSNNGGLTSPAILHFQGTTKPPAVIALILRNFLLVVIISSKILVISVMRVHGSPAYPKDKY
jgi:hypothetical protein